MIYRWFIYYHQLAVHHPLSQNARSHLFKVILPPLVTVWDVQSIQVLQGTSVISEGHLGYSLQYLVELLLTLSLDNSKNKKQMQVYRPVRVRCRWPGGLASRTWFRLYVALSYWTLVKTVFYSRLLNQFKEHRYYLSCINWFLSHLQIWRQNTFQTWKRCGTSGRQHCAPLGLPLLQGAGSLHENRRIYQHCDWVLHIVQVAKVQNVTYYIIINTVYNLIYKLNTGDIPSPSSPVWAEWVSRLPPCWSSSWSSSPVCAGARHSLWVPARWLLYWVFGRPGPRSQSARAAAPRPHLQTEHGLENELGRKELWYQAAGNLDGHICCWMHSTCVFSGRSIWALSHSATLLQSMW